MQQQIQQQQLQEQQQQQQLQEQQQQQLQEVEKRRDRSWCQLHKTFFVRSLPVFVIS
jgi:hypothetical protein